MADYTLAVSEDEVQRYRMMASVAAATEADAWTQAGIVTGARVADVGCGPAATSVELARVVGETGSVVAVERDESARAAAEQVIAAAGVTNVELRAGEATATGVEPGSVDVVMMRHVLAHNGGQEPAIVDHLATLVRPGGCVYLVDVDLTGIRVVGGDPDLGDVIDTYVEFHRRLGNDPMVGLALRTLLAAARLDPIRYDGRYAIVDVPPGMRPPAWAARDAMVRSGVVTPADVDRWAAAFERGDAAPSRGVMFAPTFVAIGRRTT